MANPNDEMASGPEDGYEDHFHGQFVSGDKKNHSLTAIHFTDDGARFSCLVRALNGCLGGKFSDNVLVILESEYRSAESYCFQLLIHVSI